MCNSKEFLVYQDQEIHKYRKQDENHIKNNLLAFDGNEWFVLYKVLFQYDIQKRNGKARIAWELLKAIFQLWKIKVMISF